jgi:hypothetical protein
MPRRPKIQQNRGAYRFLLRAENPRPEGRNTHYRRAHPLHFTLNRNIPSSNLTVAGQNPWHS